MAQSYEQLKKSFTLLNELQEDLKKKEDIKVEAEAKYQSLQDELEQIKGLRAETLEKKVLGQASDTDLKKLDSKLQALEKNMTTVKEEFEIIKGMQNTSPYDENTIVTSFNEFLSAYRENEFLAIGNELKAAKEAYISKFSEYVDAIEIVGKLKGELSDYMDRVGMKNGRYNLARLNPVNDGRYVNPNHLKDNYLTY
ncbi:hypothetical protein [Lysinibacillus sp. F5]|uniref:hypothetical protein n=1 Tax=Lysinibacillus sp. F5 TaxID=1700846 RepID=UPI00073876D7|nr:hypothetical protein [Lysinibacillus sp. F5]KUF32860.1 hypothetical protein AK833_11975 [Lysinibacillus sp. F5]